MPLDLEAVRVLHSCRGGTRLVFHYLTEVWKLSDGLSRTPDTTVGTRNVSAKRQRHSYQHEEAPFYTLSLVSILCSPQYGFSTTELVQVHGVYLSLSQAGIVYEGCQGCHMAACDGVKTCQCTADVGPLWKAKVVLTDHTAEVHATMFEAFGELIDLYKDRLTDGRRLQPAYDVDQEACQLMRLVGATPLSVLLEFARWQHSDGLSVVVRKIIPTVDIQSLTTHYPMAALPRFDELVHSRMPIATLAQTGQSPPVRTRALAACPTPIINQPVHLPRIAIPSGFSSSLGFTMVDGAAVSRCRVLLRVVDEPACYGGEGEAGVVKVVRRCICVLYTEDGDQDVEYQLQQIGDAEVVRELACLRT